MSERQYQEAFSSSLPGDTSGRRYAVCLFNRVFSAGNGMLKKKVLEAGQGRDSRPEKGQNVIISLQTSLADGSLVEEPHSVSFTLGDGDVIQV